MSPAAEKALKAARAAGAAQAAATLSVVRRGHLRFANNGPTTSGESERRTLSLEASLGKRHASGATEDLSAEGIARLAESVVAQARAAPEDPEQQPEPPAQRYASLPGAYDPALAAADPRVRAAAVKPILEAALAGSLLAAGLYEDQVRELWRVSSGGSQGTHRDTFASLSATLRRADGSASAWAGAAAVRAAELDPHRLALRAAEKARLWTDPEALPPGHYTVVLEPAAMATLLEFVDRALDARSADEGHSAFTGKEGAPIFSKEISLESDPADPLSPGLPWAEGGLRSELQVYAQGGVLKQLRRSRYWAQKTGKKPTADGGNLRLLGGGQRLEQLLGKVERGLLVTRLGYVRMLEPRSLSVTGLTRDATFLVESGKLVRAVRNFRFNQSLVDLMANVEALGREERTPESLCVAPAAVVRDFNMSSISEAV